MAGVVADEGDGKKAGVAAEKQGAKIVEEMMFGNIEKGLKIEGETLNM